MGRPLRLTALHWEIQSILLTVVRDALASSPLLPYCHTTALRVQRAIGCCFSNSMGLSKQRAGPVGAPRAVGVAAVQTRHMTLKDRHTSLWPFWSPTQRGTWRRTSSRNLQPFLITPQRAAGSSISVNKQSALWTAEASCVNTTGFELWHAAVSTKAEDSGAWLRLGARGEQGSNGSSPASAFEGKHLLPPLSPWKIPLGIRARILSPHTRSFVISLLRPFFESVEESWKQSGNNMLDGIKGEVRRKCGRLLHLSLKVSAVRCS